MTGTLAHRPAVPGLRPAREGCRQRSAQSGTQAARALKVLRRTSIIMNESVMREAAQGLDRVLGFQGENIT